MNPINDLQTSSRLSSIFNPDETSGWKKLLSSLPSLLSGTVPTFGGDYNPVMNMQGQDDPSLDTDRIMSELYQPENRMQNMFNDMIANMPQRNENPSFLRKMGGALYGLGFEDPISAQDQFIQRPFHEKMSDFVNRGKVVGDAAANERAANINQRQFAHQAAQNAVANRRADITERYNEGRLATADERARTYQQNADTNRMRAESSTALARELANGGTIQFGDDGEAYLLTKTGQLRPIPVDLFSPQELEELRQKGQIAAITAQGAQTRETKTTAPALNPNSAAGRPPSATQENAAVQGRALRAFSQNPEWQRYMNIDPITGRFLGTKMPSNGDRNTFDQINEFIFGPSAASMSSRAPNPNRRPIPGIPGGEAELRDGKWIRVK